LLQRWGYPYTEEQFRFHMTLSGALSMIDAETAERVQTAAERHFATVAHVPLCIDGLSILREEAPGAPFLLWKRCSFAQQPDTLRSNASRTMQCG
jgi:ribose 1,5-bisphosphokinase